MVMDWKLRKLGYDHTGAAKGEAKHTKGIFVSLFQIYQVPCLLEW